MIGNEDSRRQWHLDRRVPVSIILALLLQTTGIVVWATRIDSRVNTLETNTVEHNQYDRIKQTEQDARLSALEQLYSKIAVIESRQQDVIKRLDNNATKLDQIINTIKR